MRHSKFDVTNTLLGFFNICNPTTRSTTMKFCCYVAIVMTIKGARTEMTYIDHCIRPPRLIIMATLLSIAFSLPASASNTKEVISSPIRKRRVSRRKLQFTTTANSADDAIESYKLLQQKGINATTVSSSSSSFAAQTTTSNGELICTPMEECELCPLKWKQLLDKDDEKIKGEFESCTKYGRRQEFECTVLFQGELCVLVS